MTSNLNILFHLISPLQRDDRRRKETKGEVEGCVINCSIMHSRGTRWRSWLRHCAINRKVAGSIPDGVFGIFH
jgi:hypothetical protein